MGNTLVRYFADEEWAEVKREGLTFCEAHLAQAGISIPEHDEMARRIENVGARPGDNRYISLETRLTHVFALDESESRNLDFDALQRAFMHAVFGRASVYPDTKDALEYVRTAGLKTCLVSNTPWGSPPNFWREEMERLGLAQYFDAQVYCGDVGWRKPDARIFAEAASKMGALIEECVMIGDHIEWDIEGATAAGMTAIRAGGDSGVSAPDAARRIVQS